MLSCVVGSYCAANPGDALDAAAAAVCAMGLCGELAYDKAAAGDGGTASFRTYLIDAMSRMTPAILAGGAKYESRP
jgi:hydroxyethylthiazole kinase